MERPLLPKIVSHALVESGKILVRILECFRNTRDANFDRWVSFVFGRKRKRPPKPHRSRATLINDDR